jgi:hypothetical protein
MKAQRCFAPLPRGSLRWRARRLSRWAFENADPDRPRLLI